MEDENKLEERIQRIEYRLGILEKFMDEMADVYKGEQSDINYIRVEVLKDMRRNTKDLKIKYDKNQGREFYAKKA